MILLAVFLRIFPSTLYRVSVRSSLEITPMSFIREIPVFPETSWCFMGFTAMFDTVSRRTERHPEKNLLEKLQDHHRNNYEKNHGKTSGRNHRKNYMQISTIRSFRSSVFNPKNSDRHSGTKTKRNIQRDIPGETQMKLLDEFHENH